jgi:hypothetical protein
MKVVQRKQGNMEENSVESLGGPERTMGVGQKGQRVYRLVSAAAAAIAAAAVAAAAQQQQSLRLRSMPIEMAPSA